MNNRFAQIALLSSKINRQHVQLVLTIAALAMLILGIGSPADVGPSPHAPR